jgi:predicted Rossmann fold nucleotide-binding protein DprA/Smf involved in DNA uptake
MGTAGLKSDAKRWWPERTEAVGGGADVLGDEALLSRRKLGLICSQKCFGDVILKTYDFARLVRNSGIAIVSGFHSPIERDCLPILLRGQDPIIIVQGHRLSTSRLPREWRKAIDVGRLLLLSPFGKTDKRVTTELAAERNRFVAAISDEVLIPYAAPASKTEALALDLLKSGKRVYTFSDRAGPLLAAGAQLVAPEFFSCPAHAGDVLRG